MQKENSREFANNENPTSLVSKFADVSKITWVKGSQEFVFRSHVVQEKVLPPQF